MKASKNSGKLFRPTPNIRLHHLTWSQSRGNNLIILKADQRTFDHLLYDNSDSDWPTIPQVYVDGEFMGGCDTMMEMHKSGELERLVADKKLAEPQSSPLAA